MVDRNQIQQITALYQEDEAVALAIENLDAGGVIVNMTISGGPLPVSWDIPPPGAPVIVDTTHIMYPAQMLTAIKTQLSARREAIVRELAELGVT